MTINQKTHFCIECREKNTYHIRPVKTKKVIRDKEYEFIIYEAVCNACGATMNVPGLMDYNAKQIDNQYRQKEHIVSVEDICNLLRIYRMGKAPLSMALGFGEITVTRYLSGQVPSKEYSDVVRNALESPDYMIKKLEENIEKVGPTAYDKAKKAAEELKQIFHLSPKMLTVISYIFKKAEEVTPLALQKMLYYVQGIYMAVIGKEMFEEDCEAWAHGPVYPRVYEVFRTFKFNPIEDDRFAMFQNRFMELSADEKKVIDAVIDSFGMYSGKTLEKITHKETPWQEARVGCLPEETSNVVIPKSAIKEYFSKLLLEYKIDEARELREYIMIQLTQ